MNEPPAIPLRASVPRLGKAADGASPPAAPRAQRTAPLSVLVGIIASLRGAILPAIAISFASDMGVAAGLGALVFIAGLGSLLAFLNWQRLTYVVSDTDIRVESGIFSRQARSVPFERIQDVSLAEPLLARLFALVAVKFETGAGGAEDLSLAFLSAAEGERLRELVRERRDADSAPAAGADDAALAASAAEPVQRLFAMGPGRIFTFGVFEFSLAAFAVLLGVMQYLSSFTDLDPWDFEYWLGWAGEQSEWLGNLGRSLQLTLLLIGLASVIVLGFAAGLFRTFSREWGFVLERTARGLRRRRGLFTRTDVVMPLHRVQALVIATRLVRYRFGWHSLSIVSLASDNESASHIAAPFATLDEIAPIVAAVGFRLPDDRADWHHASTAYRTDKAVIDALFWVMIAGGVAVFAPLGFALIPLGVALIVFAANLYAWEFRRHAIDASQIFATQGVLAPQSRIATRLKLHSAEIAQGPIARARGYATLHLGLAGGELAIAGLPIERARSLRREIMETICATDFAHI
ncbi:MAG: PH domain-containing protein [Erythrobacter sp.]